MKRAQRTTATAASGISKSLGLVKAGLTGFAAGLTAGFFTRAIKGALDYAGSLAEVAQQVGVTARDLQVLRFAGGQVGISTEQMDKALQKFTKSLGDARNGSAEAIKTFKAVGFTDQDIKRLDVHEALLKTADGLAKITDRASRASPEVRLLGKAGQQMDTLLAGGSKRINELADAAEHLGIVLSDEQIRRADDTADKLEALKTVLAAQISGVVADNAESILGLAQSLETLTAAIIRFFSSNPQAALAIIGALAGSRFGLPGAAAGAVGGFIAGSRISQNADDANMNLEFRRQQLHKARDELNARRSFDANKGGIIQFRRGSARSGNTVADAQKEFDKQVKLANAAATSAIASVNRPAVSTTTLPPFLATAGGNKTKKAPTDRSDDALFMFQDEQRRADIDILRAKQQLAHTTDERADLDVQIFKLEQEAQDAQIDDRVRRAQRDYADGRITKSALDQVTAEAAILKQKNDEVTRLEIKAVEEQRADDKRREANDIAEHEVSIRQDQLQKQIALAETAEERRKLELELLQITYDQKRTALQDIVEHSRDQVEIANARADLASLNANFALDKAGVLQQTRGPLEDYLASLPTTAAKANEALQRLEVQGFDGLIDSVLALSEGVGKATDSLLETLKQFLLGLARLELQKMLGGALQGGGGFGGIIGAIGGLFGGGYDKVSSAAFNADVSGINFASGGSGIFRGIPGIDKNVLSMNGIPFANVSYGERMTISHDGREHGMSRGGNVYMTVNTPDADSFRRSDGQTVRSLKRRLA